MESKQDQLDKAIQEVENQRKKVLDLFNEKAYEAARLTCDTLYFKAKDKLEIDSKKIQLDAAESILDRAGYAAKQKVEHSGKVEGIRVYLPAQDGGSNA